MHLNALNISASLSLVFIVFSFDFLGLVCTRAQSLDERREVIIERVFQQSHLNRPIMILNAVSRATAGALRATKPSLLQNEIAKVLGVLAVNSKYTLRDLTL